jgi:hypothetical protein
MRRKVARDRGRASIGQPLVALRGAGQIGVGKHVDEGLVATFHRPRDFVDGRVELRLHRCTSRIEGQRRGNANNDSVADLKHVEADPSRLLAQLGIKSRHVSGDRGRT